MIQNWLLLLVTGWALVLWPHVLVVVANEKRFRLLSEAQQALLRRASREAIATAVARIRTQELAGLARICEREAAASANIEKS